MLFSGLCLCCSKAPSALLSSPVQQPWLLLCMQFQQTRSETPWLMGQPTGNPSAASAVGKGKSTESSMQSPFFLLSWLWNVAFSPLLEHFQQVTVGFWTIDISVLPQRYLDSGQVGRTGASQGMGRGERERRRDSWRSTIAEHCSKNDQQRKNNGCCYYLTSLHPNSWGPQHP